MTIEAAVKRELSGSWPNTTTKEPANDFLFSFEAYMPDCLYNCMVTNEIFYCIPFGKRYTYKKA